MPASRLASFRTTAAGFMVLVVLATLSACSGDSAGDAPSPTAPSTAASGRPPALAWSRKADLPSPRSEVASAVLDGRIYVIAGFDAAGNGTTTVEVYDPLADAWQRRTDLPEARDHAMAAAHGGRLYVFGGGGRGGATSSVFALDP